MKRIFLYQYYKYMHQFTNIFCMFLNKKLVQAIVIYRRLLSYVADQIVKQAKLS